MLVCKYSAAMLRFETQLMGQIRDRQVSLSLSTPMAINDLDSDIGSLLPQDFENDSGDVATYIMLSAELNRVGADQSNSIFLPKLLTVFQPHYYFTATARQQDCVSRRNVLFSMKQRTMSAQT